MSIEQLRRVADGPRTANEWIGYRLYLAATDHFNEILAQRGLDIRFNSGVAVVAVAPAAGHQTINEGGYAFSLVYGSSRLSQGLEPAYNANSGSTNSHYVSSLREEHVEQTAILTAAYHQLPLYGDQGFHHIYIDFPPCENCHGWLRRRPERWMIHYRGERQT